MMRDCLVQQLLRADAPRWHLLGLVRDLRRPDCWIGAGFVRNVVWAHLHGPVAGQAARARACAGDVDVDVVWFDPKRTDRAEDEQLQAALRSREPSVAWSVKNQARMHRRNGDAPYRSTADAMRHWPETATAVAARRTEDDRCEIVAPYGLGDLLGLVLRPTPSFAHGKRPLYERRVRDKGLRDRWPLLREAPLEPPPTASTRFP